MSARLLLALSLSASPAFVQEMAPPAEAPKARDWITSEQFRKFLEAQRNRQHLRVAPQSGTPVLAGPDANSPGEMPGRPCSIPLVAVKPPSENGTMRIIQPQGQWKTPTVQVPAPPCEKR